MLRPNPMLLFLAIQVADCLSAELNELTLSSTLQQSGADGAAQQVVRLRSQIESLTSAQASRDSALQDAQRQLDDARAQLAAVGAESATRARELDEARAQLQRQREEVAQAASRLAERDASLALVTQQRDEAQSKLRQMQQERAGSAERVCELEAAVQLARAEQDAAERALITTKQAASEAEQLVRAERFACFSNCSYSCNQNLSPRFSRSKVRADQNSFSHTFYRNINSASNDHHRPRRPKLEFAQRKSVPLPLSARPPRLRSCCRRVSTTWPRPSKRSPARRSKCDSCSTTASS